MLVSGVKVKESEVAQSCPTLCDPMDCSLPGFSVHGISPARILEWVTISFSRGSSRPRNRTWVSCIGGRRFNLWAIREAQFQVYSKVNQLYICMKVKSSLTLCNPMDCSPPGSSVHGIFQTRVLECVAISFSRGSSQPRDRTQVSHTASRCFTV